MKIAFLTWEYPPKISGGGGRYAEEVTERLAKSGHRVFVFSPNKVESRFSNLTHVQVPIINLPFLRLITFWLNLAFIFKFMDLRVGFDLIHVNEYVDFLLLKFLTKELPRVLTVHHLASEVVEVLKPPIIRRLKNLGSEIGIAPLLEKTSIRRADHIITVSENTRKSLIKRYNVSLGKVERIYNGFNWDVSKVCTQDKKDEQEPNDDKINILFVGRLEERKGLNFLLESLSLAKETCNFKFQFIAAGRGNLKKFNTVTKQLNLSDEVEFRGFVDEGELEKLYRTADIFVLPSKVEGFGLVLLEAIQRGLPVICTNEGGMPELIKYYNRGNIIRYGDKERLVSTILEIIELIREKKLPQPNIEKIKEKFNWKRNVKEVINVYKNMMHKK